jgi:hypothetical protein
VTQRRWSRVQSHILVWCGDEILELGFDGQPISVPPIHEVAKPGIRSPYRLPSAKTREGVPLPGTVLVEDVIVSTSAGGYKKIFDVSDLCAFLERDMPELFTRGFQIVTDPDDVKVVQAEGRPSYEKSQDERARLVLAEELQRRKKYEDAGQPAPPGSNADDVDWAIRHQKLRQAQRRSSGAEVSTADIYAALAGKFAPTAAEVADQVAPGPAASPPGVGTPTPVAQTEFVSASSMMDDAEELGVNLTKADLSGLLRGDKEVFDYIAEKIKLRREATEDAKEAKPA